jgi:hypothetical protein
MNGSKKTLAVVACVGLGGLALISACGGDATEQITPDGGGGSTSSSGTSSGGSTSSSGGSSTSEGGTSSSSGGGGGARCPDATPIPTATIDGIWHWAAPNGIQSVCTPSDIAAVKAAFEDAANQTYDDVVRELSQPGDLPSGAACLACIASTAGSANDGYMVQLTDDTQTPPQFYVDNAGACFALTASPACGQAITYLNYCAGLACGGCTNNTSYGNCLGSKGVKTACADEVSAFQTSCTAFLAPLEDVSSTLNRACGDPVDAISSMCNGGIFDGGTLGDGG